MKVYYSPSNGTLASAVKPGHALSSGGINARKQARIWGKIGGVSFGGSTDSADLSSKFPAL